MADYYSPTQYTPPNTNEDGDQLFWGSLIGPGPQYQPSALFPRFSDALFFYLDANAQPTASNHMEPSKIACLLEAAAGKPSAPDALDLLHRITFQVWSIPGRLVTARAGDPQAGSQIMVLDRYGFMMYLLSFARGNPELAIITFRNAITLFNLTDPETRQAFPMMPRSALPLVADAEATQLDALVAQRYQVQRQQMDYQAQAQYQHMMAMAQMQANNQLTAMQMRAQIARRGGEISLMALGGSDYTYKYI